MWVWSPKDGDVSLPFLNVHGVGQATPAPLGATTITRSVATALTASTTQTLAGALPLTAMVNKLATVANAGDAAKLPAAQVGLIVDIFNDGAHAAKIFPAGASDTIDAGSAGAAVTLTNALRCRFYCMSITAGAAAWESAQLGVVSA